MKTGKILSVLAIAFIFTVVGNIASYAKLGGGQDKTVSNSCKQVFNFNLIQYPKDEKPGGCGQGNRIFSIETAGHEHLEVHDGDGWYIGDCGNGANPMPIIVSDYPGDYQVAVMVNGKMDDAILDIICVEPVSSHDHTECIVDNLQIKRPGGKSRFQIVTSDIFNADAENLIWSYEGNTNFKKALFKIYDCSE